MSARLRDVKGLRILLYEKVEMRRSTPLFSYLIPAWLTFRLSSVSDIIEAFSWLFIPADLLTPVSPVIKNELRHSRRLFFTKSIVTDKPIYPVSSWFLFIF